MSLFSKGVGIVAVIGAGSLAYGYVNPNVPLVGPMLTKFKSSPSEEVSSSVGATTSIESQRNKSDARARLWAEEAAYLKAEEKKQAQHRAKCRANQSKSTAKRAVRKCGTGRSTRRRRS